MGRPSDRAQTLTNGAAERASPIRGGHCARLTLSHPHSHRPTTRSPLPFPPPTPPPPFRPRNPNHFSASASHAAAGTRCAGSGKGSDGGRLASYEDGEGRRDGSGRGHHLGHHRRHLVRRAPGGAPRRAPGPRPDAQDVRQLRGHFRRRRRALHRRGADCAEPAQEARLRQRSHRRLRLRRHRLWIQRKEH